MKVGGSQSQGYRDTKTGRDVHMIRYACVSRIRSNNQITEKGWPLHDRNVGKKNEKEEEIALNKTNELLDIVITMFWPICSLAFAMCIICRKRGKTTVS